MGSFLLQLTQPSVPPLTAIKLLLTTVFVCVCVCLHAGRFPKQTLKLRSIKNDRIKKPKSKQTDGGGQ